MLLTGSNITRRGGLRRQETEGCLLKGIQNLKTMKNIAYLWARFHLWGENFSPFYLLAWHNKTFHYLVPTSTHLLFNYFQLCVALQNCKAPCSYYFLVQNILLVNFYSSLKAEMLPLGTFPCSN